MNSHRSHLNVPFCWVQTGPTTILTFLDIRESRDVPFGQCVAPDDLERASDGELSVSWFSSRNVGATFVELWEIQAARVRKR